MRDCLKHQTTKTMNTKASPLARLRHHVSGAIQRGEAVAITEHHQFYTCRAISRKTGEKFSPRFDLLPMNHEAVCNFMDACRNRFTDYEVFPWPQNVPLSGPPVFAESYRETSLSNS
jgi:hypothetical protein